MTSIISEKITEEERDELAIRYHLLLDSGRMFETYPDAKGYFDADVKNDEIMMGLMGDERNQ